MLQEKVKTSDGVQITVTHEASITLSPQAVNALALDIVNYKFQETSVDEIVKMIRSFVDD